MRSRLRIHALELPVHIGVSAEERSRSQMLEFNLCFEFKKLPVACETDELEQTFCYDVLANNIENFVSGKKFKLIEKLAFELVNLLKVQVADANSIELQVKKLQPPIRQKNQGASFSILWERPV